MRLLTETLTFSGTGSIQLSVIEALPRVRVSRMFVEPDAGNSHICYVGDAQFTFGTPITSGALDAGGSGYAIHDTGTITTGSGDATYEVDTVDGGGAVLTFHLVSHGTAYVSATGAATAITSGAGDGNFTITIVAPSPTAHIIKRLAAPSATASVPLDNLDMPTYDGTNGLELDQYSFGGTSGEKVHVSCWER